MTSVATSHSSAADAAAAGDGEVELSFDLSFEHDEQKSPRGAKPRAAKGKKASAPLSVPAARAAQLDDGGERRLSPVVSAETEALMRRLRSASESGGSALAGDGDAAAAAAAAAADGEGVAGVAGAGAGAGATLLAAPAVGVAYQHTPHHSSLSHGLSGSYTGTSASYGTSPSFAELGLTKTAESLAASEGVAATNANGVIVYGEPGTALDPTALLEAIGTLRFRGEVKRHWHREGQHFAFVEFTSDVEADDMAKQIAGLTLGDVQLTAEKCRRITPGRDPRTHRATSVFKSSTLVLKNLPFQLRQESLADILMRLPSVPQSINYHYDTTGAFRGMAFVKYATIDDAYNVFDELNGLDIMGRALRVEYKRHSSNNDGNHGNDNGDGAGSIAAAVGGGRHRRGSVEHKGGNGKHHHQNGRRGSQSSGSGQRHPPLDPNDLSSEARAFYEQLVMFKQNSRLNELAFPPSLTVHQRKQLHYLADQIGGLAHCAVGEGSARFLVVSKHQAPHMSSRNNTGRSPGNSHGFSGSFGGQHYGGSPRSDSFMSRSPNSGTSRSWNDRGRHHNAWGVRRQHGSKDGGSNGSNGAKDNGGNGSGGAAHSPRGGKAGGGEQPKSRSRANTGSDNSANQVKRQPRGPTSERGFGQ